MKSDVDSGNNPERLGLGLFLLGAFPLVLVTMAFLRPPQPGVEPAGLASIAQAIVSAFGFLPPAIVAGAVAGLGVWMFLGNPLADPGRHLLGALGVAGGAAVALGALGFAGGNLGARTGGFLASSLGAWAGLAVGVAVVAGVAGFCWLGWALPGGDQPREGETLGDALIVRDEDGVSVAEASALVPDNSTMEYMEELWRSAKEESPQLAPVPPSPYPEDVRLQGGVPEGAQAIAPTPVEAPRDTATVGPAGDGARWQRAGVDRPEDPFQVPDDRERDALEVMREAASEPAPAPMRTYPRGVKPLVSDEPAAVEAEDLLDDEPAHRPPRPRWEREPLAEEDGPLAEGEELPEAELEDEDLEDSDEEHEYEEEAEDDEEVVAEDEEEDPEASDEEYEYEEEEEEEEAEDDEEVVAEDEEEDPEASDEEYEYEEEEEEEEEEEAEDDGEVVAEDEEEDPEASDEEYEYEEEEEEEEAEDDEEVVAEDEEEDPEASDEEYEYEEEEEEEEAEDDGEVVAEDEEEDPEASDEEYEYEEEEDEEEAEDDGEVVAEDEEEDPEASDEEYEYEEEEDEEEAEDDGEVVAEDEEEDPEASDEEYEYEEEEDEEEAEDDGEVVAEDEEEDPEASDEEYEYEEEEDEEEAEDDEEVVAEDEEEDPEASDEEYEDEAAVEDDEAEVAIEGDPEPEVVLQPQAGPAPEAAEAAGAPVPLQVTSQVREAGLLFLEEGRVAVSLLQRRFGLDFEEACGLIDDLQEAGLIGPYEGGQQRTILLEKEEWEAIAGSAGSPVAGRG